MTLSACENCENIEFLSPMLVYFSVEETEFVDDAVQVSWRDAVYVKELFEGYEVCHADRVKIGPVGRAYVFLGKISDGVIGVISSEVMGMLVDVRVSVHVRVPLVVGVGGPAPLYQTEKHMSRDDTG